MKALDADTENITALNQLIKAAYELQEFNNAIGCTRNYLMYHPGDLDILFALAGILYKSGEFEEAQDSLERLMSLSPEYEGAKELLSKILTDRSQLSLHMNEPDSSQQILYFSENLIEQGHANKLDGNFAEAYECFSKARELGDLSVFSDMGDCKANLGEYSEAERLYENGLKNDPENIGSLVGLGIVRLLQGKHVKAVTSFNKALNLAPADTKALCGLGMVRNVQGKQKEALECFSRALDTDPENLPALHELIKCSYGLKRFEEAERHLTTYLIYHPGDLDMQFSLAGVRFSNEKYHDALENIENLLAFDPGFTGGEELRVKIQMQLAANS